MEVSNLQRARFFDQKIDISVAPLDAAVRTPTPNPRTPTPIPRPNKRPSSVVYYAPLTPVETARCINNACPSRAAASGVAFSCENDACECCGTIQHPGGYIGDCSDVTFREAEDDENRRVEAVKKKKRSKLASDAVSDHTHSAVAFHSVLDELRFAKKSMWSAAESKVSHLLPVNIPGLYRGPEIAELEKKAKEIETKLEEDFERLGGHGDAFFDEVRDLCQKAKSDLIGDAFDGLDPRVDMIGALMSETGQARRVKDVDEMRKNVHTHFHCFIHSKRSALYSANVAYKAARSAELAKQTFHITAVERDGVTPILNEKGELVTRLITYKEAVEAMEHTKKQELNKEDDMLVPVMRAVFGWVTFVYVFRGGSDFGDAFGMDRWGTSHACVQWYENATDYLLRYKQIMHPLRPVHAHKEIYCMHAIILASRETDTPLSWKRVRPMFLGSADGRFQHWAAQENHPVIPTCRLTQLAADLESVASKLQIKSNWIDLVRNFSIFFEEQLRQIYGFKVVTTDNSVLSLVEKVGRTASKAQINAMRLQLGVEEMRSQLGLENASPVASSSLPPISSMTFPSFGTTPLGFMDFSPQVVAISCVRAVYGTRPFSVRADELSPEIAETMNIKCLRKAHFKKRPRVSVTKGGQDSATIKAEVFSELAGADSRDVAACSKLLQPLL